MNNLDLDSGAKKIADLLGAVQFDESVCGGALTVFKDGRCILATAVGQANANHAWTPHTLSVNFSIGKGVMATLIAVLVSKGFLAYDKPISDYWADFAQNGKADVRVIDVLTHTADLFDITSVITDNDSVKDWQAMLTKVASMPKTPPSHKQNQHYGSAYSALVSGFILGGLVERVLNQPLQDVLDQYLAVPLGIQGELFFGLPSVYHDKLAVPYRLFDDNTLPRKKPTLKPDSQAMTDLYHSLLVSDDWLCNIANNSIANNSDDKNGNNITLTTTAINRLYFDTPSMNMQNYKNALLADGKTPIDYHDKDLLCVPMPSANGVSTSYALALMYAMHANNGVWQGKTLINSDVMRVLRQVRTHSVDAVMPADMRWRAGFHKLFTMYHAPNAYGHMGYNGSVAFCDPDRQLSLAFIHNFDTTMLNDVRQFVITESVLKWLDSFTHSEI